MAGEKTLIPSFYSGFLKLFSGLALVKVLNVVFSLILPRVYSPDDYALFGIFTAVVLILAEINTLKLDITIFFPKEDREALEIVHVVFLLSVLFSALILALSIIAVITGLYSPVYLLLAFVLMINGVGLALTAWFNRKQDYKRLNIYTFIQSFSIPVLSLVFIIFFKWHSGLITGFIIGQFVGVSYLIASFKHLEIKLMNRSLALKYIRRYSQFPKYGVLSSLLNSISRNSVVIFIKNYFGVLNAGYYTLASRVLSIPGGMYSSALTQIYLQQASLLDNHALKIYTKRILWFGFVVGICPLILFLFFGQPIFTFVFGAKWLLAGKMAQFIALWFFFQVLIGPAGFILDIKQKLKYELNWNIILLVFRFAAILIGVLLNDLYLMLSIITGAGVLMYIVLLRYVFRLIDEEAK